VKKLISNHYFFYFLFFLILFLTSSHTFTYAFIYDDRLLVTDFLEVPLFQKFDAMKNYAKFHFYPVYFLTHTIDQILTNTFINLENYLDEKRMIIPRISNFIFHLLNSIILFQLLKKILNTKDNILIFISVIFFFFYPIVSQPLFNVMTRNELLYILFSLATFNQAFSFIEKNNWQNCLKVNVLFFLALCSKLFAITYLVIIPLFFITKFYYTKNLKKNFEKISVLFLSLLVTFLCYQAIRYLNTQSYHLIIDNNFFFNIPKQNKIKVLAIGYSKSNYLNRIFTEDEFIFSFSTQDQLNYNNIQKQNLIILNELNSLSNTLDSSLKTFLTNDGTVLFIPSSIGSLESYNDLLGIRNLNLTSKYNETRKIIKINFGHPLFDQSFEREVSNFKYPKVASFYKIKTSLKPLLEFEDGNPFLVEKNRFFMFSAPLNTTNSNFTNSPLIVPTLYGIGKSCYKAPKLYYRIGEYNEINLDYELKNDAILSLSKGEDNFIPLQSMQNSKLKLNFEDLPEKAGHYALKSKTDTIQHVSFNYERKESEIGTYNSKNLTQKEYMKSIESAFESIKSEVNIKELWKWFVTFALIFLILEMIILKFFR